MQLAFPKKFTTDEVQHLIGKWEKSYFIWKWCLAETSVHVPFLWSNASKFTDGFGGSWSIIVFWPCLCWVEGILVDLRREGLKWPSIFQTGNAIFLTAKVQWTSSMGVRCFSWPAQVLTMAPLIMHGDCCAMLFGRCEAMYLCWWARICHLEELGLNALWLAQRLLSSRKRQMFWSNECSYVL